MVKIRRVEHSCAKDNGRGPTVYQIRLQARCKKIECYQRVERDGARAGRKRFARLTEVR